jgi:hypothetical protein
MYVYGGQDRSGMATVHQHSDFGTLEELTEKSLRTSSDNIPAV